MDSRTFATPITIEDLLFCKALLAPESLIPIPHLGICDPETGDQMYEFVVMAPLTHKDQLMEVEELAKEIRQKGEHWLEKREKEWKEQLREYFGLVPPS